MKTGICIIGLLLFLSSNLSAQQWTLDNCAAYAQENNKCLLSQEQNRAAVIIGKKTAWVQLAPEVEFVAGLDYYWQIPIQTFLAEIVGVNQESPYWNTVDGQLRFTSPYETGRCGT